VKGGFFAVTLLVFALAAVPLSALGIHITRTHRDVAVTIDLEAVPDEADDLLMIVSGPDYYRYDTFPLLGDAPEARALLENLRKGHYNVEVGFIKYGDSGEPQPYGEQLEQAFDVE
jgi:hypothetical protein